MSEEFSDSQKMSELIKEAVRSYEVTNYNGLSCGPNIVDADEIIIVEGRADVINLLKNGVKNVIAFEGSKIPEAVINLTREKTTTAFLDGDRGGDLDLKKLLIVADIDYVTRADPGKEVEELTKKQIFKALRERVPVDQAFEKREKEEYKQERQEPPEAEEVSDERKKFLHSLLEDLMGTRAAYLLDSGNQILSKVPISELSEMIENYPVHTIVMDGKINQSLIDLALQKKIACIVATDYKERVNTGSIKILVKNDFVTA
jgi:DNA primase